MAPLAVAVVALALGVFPDVAEAEAEAKAFTVTNTNDSGEGSLREAINQANGTWAWGGTDTITFDLPQGGPKTITLASTLPHIVQGAIIIDGGEAADITVSGDGKWQLFANGGDLTLRNLTLTRGFKEYRENVGMGWGGAVYNVGTLRVEGCTFSENRADIAGGAIYNRNNLIVVDSVFSANSAGGYLRLGSGGAIYNALGFHVEGSTFSGNSAAVTGGAIENSGTLTVVDSALSGNSAKFGGGVRNTGGVKAYRSTFSDNRAEIDSGGGIHHNSSDRTLEVYDSSFLRNGAYSSGGGIHNQGPLAVQGSTFSGNSAGSFGGGIYSYTAPVTDTDPLSRAIVANSTLSGNAAGSAGGGIYNGIGLVTLKSTTIIKNTAPAGRGSGVSSYARSYARTDVSSSIISANTNSDLDVVDGYEGSPNTFRSNGHSLVGGGNATGAFNQNGDQTGVADPGLGDLADNGGPTKTHALLPGSPAIDAGDPAFGPTPEFDQRGAGFPRIQNERVDVGALERQPGEGGDTTPPELFGVPSDMNRTATTSAGTEVSYQQPTATDAMDGDVPVQCSPASGSRLALGATTVRCSAIDEAGNEAEETFKVSVAYAWSGILKPINADGSSLFKMGSPVAVKFQLTGESAGITDATAKLYLATVADGAVGTEIAAGSTTATSGNLFRYDTESAQYVLNWATKGLGAGTYQLRVDLGDGTTNAVRVSLR